MIHFQLRYKMNGKRKIYIYHLTPRMHSSMKLMIEHPPEGYEFILAENKMKKRFLQFALNAKLMRWLYRKIVKKIINPLKVYDTMYSAKIPPGMDIIFSASGTLDIQSPYIIEILDSPYMLSGNDYHIFMKNKIEIEKKLLSPFCKRIIIVNETSQKLMRKYFGKEVMQKTVLIPAAIQEQKFKKRYKKKGIQLIFVGSMVNPDDFEIKGGLETLEVFKKLSQEIPGMTLIMLGKVPEYAKERYKDVKDIRIIEEYLPWDVRKKIYLETDICMNPGHIYPLMATLETMSFGIPIIMLDTYGVRDYLKPGVNSFLVQPSKHIRGYGAVEYPCNIRTPEFIRDIKQIDEAVIEQIYQSAKKLIKNPALRKKMGEYSRRLVREKFSLTLRNKKLKEVFDEALGLKKENITPA